MKAEISLTRSGQNIGIYIAIIAFVFFVSKFLQAFFIFMFLGFPVLPMYLVLVRPLDRVDQDMGIIVIYIDVYERKVEEVWLIQSIEMRHNHMGLDSGIKSSY